MKSILDTLPPETLETLASWSEDDTYKEVKKRAAKPKSEGGLELHISESTLNRLYTTHGIADSKEARQQYRAHLEPEHCDLFNLAEDNLHTRLLELSARPNPSVAELRLLSQIITKLRALDISERRIQVAERREHRLERTIQTGRTSSHESPSSSPCYTKEDIEPKQTNEEIAYRTRVLLGKEFDDEGNPIQEPPPSPQALAAPKPPPETQLTVQEMAHRVRVILGKEPENEMDEQIRHKQRLYEEWKKKMLKTRKPASATTF